MSHRSSYEKIFRKRKLQIRFFLAYLTIALLVTGAFSIFFYRYTSQILIRRETKALADLNTSLFPPSIRFCRT